MDNERLFEPSNLILSYSDDDAIADGMLVHPYPEKYPYLLLTAAVFAKCERVAKERGAELKTVLMPLMMGAVLRMRQVRRLEDKERLVTDGLEHTAVGLVWVALNASGGMTIMFPEDY